VLADQSFQPLTSHSDQLLGLHRQLHWGARQLSWGLLGVRLFCAELGTPLVVGFRYVFASLRLSWCAIKMLHDVWIRVLIRDNMLGP
jgi:hypothetical protein